MSSKLFYYGTNKEVDVGDRVEYRTLFLKRRRPGAIVCVPEKTALELEEEKKDPQDWLIRFDDGTYTSWLYHPEEIQPLKRLSFIGRSAGEFETITNEELDRLDTVEAERWPGVVGGFVGCATILVLAFIGLVVLLGIF